MHKPRILVCAHSNAAADELLMRVKHGGFIDGEGQRYFPDVVRIGSDDAPMQPGVKQVFVEEMARCVQHVTCNKGLCSWQ